ncbi:MAG: HAMP domain-containing protein [Deltaproteobacteria bacterium]|nr:HAMP domain-containing protein [Deltaproteobacteria bacterium]
MNSLKTGILAQLTFLILVAMLLINVVTIKLAERELIAYRLQTGRLLIQAVEQMVGQHLSGSGNKMSDLTRDPLFQPALVRLLDEGNYAHMVIVNREGEKLLSVGFAEDQQGEALSGAREAAGTRIVSHHLSGSTWGVIWLSKRNLWISSPLSFQGRLEGGVNLSCSLVSVYETLRKSQRIVLFYIFLDTLVLVMVGLVLLSRIVVKPIHQLLHLTAGYKEGDRLPALTAGSRNEIGELSRSLHNMLRHLEENKKELRDHILSLEKANKDLKHAQDEIIRSEKLASVGRLAAGIAHEIGNPIGIVLGYLDLLKRGDIADEEKKDFLLRIESEITRISQIIKDLLDFSRPSSGELMKTNVHEALQNTLSILAPQPMMESIQRRIELKANDDVVFASPNRLQQVFLNILLNAADALAMTEKKEKVFTIRSENQGENIRISFSDNGTGIARDKLAHIFDPFYTTKEPGRGLGLGLSVSYRIVESLGGSMNAESELDHGTEIIVSIPLAANREKDNRG